MGAGKSLVLMRSRRHFLESVVAVALTSPRMARAENCDGWADWIIFRDKFVQADGRVVDFSADAQSTSESQAYAMFFALVANDRPSFDRLLTWTRANLAQGDLSARLMAWKWGRRTDGSWGVIDNNAAGDAALWLAYVLFQAARRWRDSSLRAAAELMQARIEKELVVDVAGVGPVLLPGPQGFVLKSGGWKLNPSYLPLPVLRGLATEVPTGVWGALVATTVSMIESVTPHYLVPDWVALRPERGFVLDPELGYQGSYDAIRAYLWAAMMPTQDPMRNRLLARMKGMKTLVERLLVPPASVNAYSGESEGSGPGGFSAALLPYLVAVGAKIGARQQRLRIVAMGGVPLVYYEQALGLFSLGWIDQRFRFAPDGRLDWGVTLTCKM